MINGSLLLRTAGRSSFDPSARDRLGSGIFPDVSRSSLDASGITDCWEAGDLCEAVAAVRRIDVFAVHAVTVMPLRDVKVRLANSEVAVTEIYLRPPAQIPASAANAPGSHLGWWAERKAISVADRELNWKKAMGPIER